tara:strand:+ start:583 stop:1245 length:663 start_codon:yes stop_codon:yes gene_type:complete
MIKKFINLTIYILRYFSIIKYFDYKVSKKIKFGSKNADEYFVKNLKKSKYYLEYGSGSSTILAKKYKKKFLSIETDKSFFKYMRNLKIDEIIYTNIGPTKYYSQPILPTLILKNQIKRYASQIEIFFKRFNRLPDLVLIDGRFRVYVTLVVVYIFFNKNSKKKLTIIIDDYRYRKNYHYLEKIVKIKLIGRFGIITLNNKSKLNLTKLKKYFKVSILDYN